MLDPSGKLGLLKSAQRSIMSAHYTPYHVLDGIYDGLRQAGFTSGNILEPSAGIGNFLAAMPLDMANRSEVTAIEMDPMTGMILRRLFPTVETKIAPFEKTRLPENHYDLVLSNVPFGDVGIYDPQLENQHDRAFAKASNNLHNYFFAKSILLARPGGMIALVTSRFTLDNAQASAVRELMDRQCEFLGAIRMPDSTFKGNAGTEVVADIILLRKAEIGETIEQKHAFLDVRSVPFTDASGKSGIISYNEYFHDNPNNMLGTVEYGGLYNKESFNLKGHSWLESRQNISNVFDNIFPAPVYVPKNKAAATVESVDEGAIKNFISLGLYDSIGNIVSLDGNRFGTITGENYIEPSILERAKAANVDVRSLQEGKPDGHAERWMSTNGIFLTDFSKKIVDPLKIAKPDSAKLPLLTKIRWLTKEVIYREADGWTGQTLENRRETLRELYQDYVKKFGNLTSRDNEKVLSYDTDGILIQSLEKKDPVTKKISPSDILYRPTIKMAQEITFTDNIRDAIMLSLKRKGHLDMNLVCELMDSPYAELMATQKGDKAEIFIDAVGKHVPREDFLSGNILQKLGEEEKSQADLDPKNGEDLFRSLDNIEQLKKVLPKPIEATDIYAPLHARWIPESDISAFIKETIRTEYFDMSFSRSLDEFKLRISWDNAHTDAFKTQRRKAEWIFNHALNGIEPIVNYTDADGRQIFDPEDTHLAKENYKAIRNAWDD